MYYENEKEWLKKIEEERNELDRNQKITNARLEGYEKGISDGESRGEANNLNKNIRSMCKNGCGIEFIAKVLEQSIEYVQNVLNEK